MTKVMCAMPLARSIPASTMWRRATLPRAVFCMRDSMPASANLPTPDFSFDPDLPGACIAGVRPFRNGSYRLDAQTISDKFIVHNYGHGGAGITLSWGCAAKVRDIVKTHLLTSHDTDVAVLGAGVMGLTAATLLLDLGLNVTIYSDRQVSET